MSAELQPRGSGELALSGELNFTSVAALWPQLAEQIHSAPLQVSMEGVTAANSAALALLLEARQLAGRRGASLSFRDVPQDLKDLAGLSNVLQLIAS